MGLFDKKLDLISHLKVSTSLGSSLKADVDGIKENAKRFHGGLKSLNSKNSDPLEFLIDLAVILIGTPQVEAFINKIMVKFLDGTGGADMKFETRLKYMLLNSLYVEDDTKVLPEDFFTSGYTLPIKVIDIFEKFRYQPTSKLGKILNDVNSDGFVKAVVEEVLQIHDPVAVSSMKHVTLQYKLIFDALTVKPNTELVTTATTINQFFDEIVLSDRFKIINRRQIIIDVMDVIFGFIANKKSAKGLGVELMIDEALDKIANEEEMETVFQFDPALLDRIDKDVDARKRGGYDLDLGCSLESINISEEDIEGVLNEPDLVVGMSRLLGTQLAQNGVEMNDAIRENYNRKILKALVSVIIKNTIFSPNVWFLILLSGIFKTGFKSGKYDKYIASGLNKLDFLEILKGQKNLIKEITDSLRSLFVETLLNMLIKQILKMITPILVEKQKEKLLAIKSILESLL